MEVKLIRQQANIIGANSYSFQFSKDGNMNYSPYTLYLQFYTTHNCQTITVSPFENLLYQKRFSNEEILEVLTKCIALTDRNTLKLIIFDIKDAFVERFLEVFKPIWINSYLSTSSNRLSMGMFHIDNDFIKTPVIENQKKLLVKK